MKFINNVISAVAVFLPISSKVLNWKLRWWSHLIPHKKTMHLKKRTLNSIHYKHGKLNFKLPPPLQLPVRNWQIYLNMPTWIKTENQYFSKTPIWKYSIAYNCLPNIKWSNSFGDIFPSLSIPSKSKSVLKMPTNTKLQKSWSQLIFKAPNLFQLIIDR